MKSANKLAKCVWQRYKNSSLFLVDTAFRVVLAYALNSLNGG